MAVSPLRSALLGLLLATTGCRTAAPAPTDTAAPDPLIQGLTQMVQRSPEDRAILYALASRHAQRGEQPQAFQYLERLDALGWDHALEPTDFAALASTPEFRELSGRISARAPQASAGETAFTLPERDLIPEGIAWDPQTGTFFVGSIHRRKVAAVSQDGTVRDFIPEARDGLWSVLGLKVDAAKRHLWVTSWASRGGKDIPQAERGHNSLHQYDLRTGALLRKVPLEATSGTHLLNDLALAANGDVFVTNSEAGGVLVLRAGSDTLTPLVPEGTLIYPNGLALSEDGTRLYVAQFHGLVRVDPASGQVTRVQPPPGTTLGGVDGLSTYGRTLVAVQNGNGRGRIVRFHLGEDPDRVERVEVLGGSDARLDTPTTGAVAGRHFVYIANSHVRALGADGKLPPVESLSPPLLLRLPLP
jgi:sugar lactone lactonase YvrE